MFSFFPTFSELPMSHPHIPFTKLSLAETQPTYLLLFSSFSLFNLHLFSTVNAVLSPNSTDKKWGSFLEDRVALN